MRRQSANARDPSIESMVRTMSSWTVSSERPVAMSQTKANSRNKLDTTVYLAISIFVTTNAHISSMRASLYVSEDNEAVTKKIMKGWSPNKHETHRVHLD